MPGVGFRSNFLLRRLPRDNFRLRFPPCTFPRLRERFLFFFTGLPFPLSLPSAQLSLCFPLCFLGSISLAHHPSTLDSSRKDLHLLLGAWTFFSFARRWSPFCLMLSSSSLSLWLRVAIPWLTLRSFYPTSAFLG